MNLSTFKAFLEKNVELQLWILLGQEAEVASVPTSSIPCPSWTQGLSGGGSVTLGEESAVALSMVFCCISQGKEVVTVNRLSELEL